MGRPRVYKGEGIVLRHTPIGEADIVLSIYTPQWGKVRAVAKGVRRPQSKLAGHVEPLTRLSLLLAQGRNLDVLAQGETLEAFPAIRNDLDTLARALYAVELVDRFSPEASPVLGVYQLLLSLLRALQRPEGADTLLRFFELHLLEHLGYRPELHHCIECRGKLPRAINHFVPSLGGTVCPSCTPKQAYLYPVSVNAVKVLRFLQETQLEAVRSLQVSGSLANEVEGVLERYVNFLMEEPARSAAFLHHLQEHPLAVAAKGG